MKMQQGAEIPDELVFKEVAESNHLASVTIVTKEELAMLLDRRKRPSKRLWFLERRGKK
jgi:hypothetical protein